MSQDITGRQFGRLTAVKQLQRTSGKYHYWLCVCTCGAETQVLYSNLVYGRTKSCGCARREERDSISPGDVFGRLTAIEPTGEKLRSSTVWRCRCVCGNERFASVRSLISGSVKSCGCLSRERREGIDITGQRFGNLTAIERTGEKRFHSCVWRCRCDCGNEIDVSLNYLRSRTKTNCGCRRTRDNRP